MDLKKMLADALAKAAAIQDGAKALGRDLNAEELGQLKSIQTEAEALAEKIKAQTEGDALRKAFDDLSAKGEEEPTSEAPKRAAKSLGQHVVNELGPKVKGKRGTQNVSVSAPEFKAAGDTHVTGGASGTFGGVLTAIDTNIVTAPRRALTIEDLLGAETVSGAAITYFVEGALEGGFGMVAEDGKKPQLKFADPTPVTEALAKIAGYIKESDELLEDLPWFASAVEGRLMYQLGLMVEDQLLNGSGTGGNLRGILQRSGVQVEASAAKADNPDAIFRATTKVQTGSGFAADGLVINPADYQALRLMRDANEQYFGGGFFSGQYGQGGIVEQPPVWGLRTVVTPAITQGTALVGAFKQSASVLSKGGVRVDVTNTNEDDFIHNRVTMLAERRLGLAARRPAGFAKVTLSDVVA